MRILIIDNYDSFTYNLYQYAGELLSARGETFELDVARNDEITLAEIKKRGYGRIIISPGPGDPADAAYFGVCAEVLVSVSKKVPTLGVCLGMQGMAHYYGGKVVRAKLPMHGKTSSITHDGKGIFENLPQRLEVMRYHSLVAERESLPECFEITAIVSNLSQNWRGSFANAQDSLRSALNKEENIEIMGLRHKKYPIEGIQFHPESFATEGGKVMLSNFLFQGLD